MAPDSSLPEAGVRPQAWYRSADFAAFNAQVAEAVKLHLLEQKAAQRVEKALLAAPQLAAMALPSRWPPSRLLCAFDNEVREAEEELRRGACARARHTAEAEVAAAVAGGMRVAEQAGQYVESASFGGVELAQSAPALGSRRLSTLRGTTALLSPLGRVSLQAMRRIMS